MKPKWQGVVTRQKNDGASRHAGAGNSDAAAMGLRMIGQEFIYDGGLASIYLGIYWCGWMWFCGKDRLRPGAGLGLKEKATTGISRGDVS